MFTEERRKKIYEIIKLKKRIDITSLINEFKVSGTTIRLDLSFLEKEGKIIRAHGGAILNEKEDDLSKEDPIFLRKDLYIEQKK